MSYIKNNLGNNEHIIYLTGPHWMIFFPAMVSFLVFLIFFIGGHSIIHPFVLFGISAYGFLCLALFLITIFHALLGYIRYTTSEYGITNQRIVIKVGFIRRDTLEVLLKRVESIQVDQTVPGRLFNYGSITIRGTGGTHDPFDFVPAPLEFRKAAQEQVAL